MRQASRRARWSAVVMVVVVAVTGCESKPESKAQPPTAKPIAGCVGEDEQRTNGTTVKLSDGSTVDAMIYGTGDAAVVFANQVDGDLCQWLWAAQTLAQQGSRAMVFNYSLSAGPDEDVLAAVAALRGQGAKRVFLVGASKGGTAVLTAAATASPPVTGVVSLSAPQVFSGINAADAVATLSAPVVFIAGENDGAFASEARALYEACAAKDKKLEILSSSQHGVGLVDDKVFRLIQDFMASH